MKKLIYIFLLPLILFSCKQEEAEFLTEGYLKVNEIEQAADLEICPLATRAVHQDLQLDIYRGAIRLYSYAVGDPALNAPIALPVGSYTLVARSADLSEPQDASCGIPLYSVSHDFEIQNGQTTVVEGLVASRVNAGVSVQYENDIFDQTMSEIYCVVSSASGRTVTISGTKDNTVYYFSVPKDGKLTYYIHCKNIDGEEFQTAPKAVTVDQPKDYVIQIGL